MPLTGTAATQTATQLQRNCHATGTQRQPTCSTAHLLWWHGEVQHPEVLLEPVAYEHAAGVKQVVQLEVGRLERHQVVLAGAGVKVTCKHNNNKNRKRLKNAAQQTTHCTAQVGGVVWWLVARQLP
jgi:hypothetical protein